MRSTLERRSALALARAASAFTVAPRVGRAQATTAPSAEARLRVRGVTLPPSMAPVAIHVPAVRTGDLVFLSGLGPVLPGGGFATGEVGRDATVEEAYQHARLTGLQLLAALRGAVGTLDAVTRVVKVLGMVKAVPEFTGQPRVINGCPALPVEVFGDRGRHARTAVGMGSLPFDITVEIEAVFEVA